MGKHQILQNCSQSLQLNSIFEFTKCCFFCSNSVIKSIFFSQCSVLSARLRTLTVSIATETSSCSWLCWVAICSFIQKAGLLAIERPYWVLHFSPFKTIRVTCLRYSIVFGKLLIWLFLYWHNDITSSTSVNDHISSSQKKIWIALCLAILLVIIAIILAISFSWGKSHQLYWI